MQTSALALREAEVPLCVDLDGTLVQTDTLLELLLALFKRKPILLLMFPFWCLRGKSYVKLQAVKLASVNVASLPYQKDLVDFLWKEHPTRRVFLVTAAHERIAEKVVEHLGCFDGVIASDATTSLKGLRKRDRLISLFGLGGFDYIGNSRADLSCLLAARHAMLSSPSWPLRRIIRSNDIPVIKCFDSRPPVWREFLRAIRIKQWAKNLLIPLPLILAHRVGDQDRVLAVALTVVAFGCCASAGYLLNDLLDIESDRAHPVKVKRPFAAGSLSIWTGIGAIPCLLAVAVVLASFLPKLTSFYLMVYFAATLTYSFYLKRLLLVDVIALAGLYTLRIIAGGAAAQVDISQWLAAFSMFFFLSLAMLKRYVELRRPAQEDQSLRNGRGYVTADMEQLRVFGSSSGYVATLVLALYINRSEVTALYSKPQWLWFVCIIVIYWISRTWLLADRGEMNEDPIVFALGDKTTYLLGFLALLIIVAAL
jgi:4-hydroxybenzoate polyprenyltransferase